MKYVVGKWLRNTRWMQKEISVWDKYVTCQTISLSLSLFLLWIQIMTRHTLTTERDKINPVIQRKNRDGGAPRSDSEGPKTRASPTRDDSPYNSRLWSKEIRGCDYSRKIKGGDERPQSSFETNVTPYRTWSIWRIKLLLRSDQEEKTRCKGLEESNL